MEDLISYFALSCETLEDDVKTDGEYFCWFLEHLCVLINTYKSSFGFHNTFVCDDAEREVPSRVSPLLPHLSHP